jgi:hypothetical protein
VSDPGFAYSSRWFQLGPVAPVETITHLEERDRELEQYLDAPAQVVAVPRLIQTTSPFTDVTASVSSLTARWERQRGQWVSFEAQGLGSTGVPTGVVLPLEVPPLAPGLGRGAVIGSAGTASAAALVSPLLVNSQWVLPVTTGTWWFVHVLYLASQ